ncbi:MAG TPA: ABC transporter permease [Vicinamibacterales bacterium]|nr:ABC transporter permease [Vicinamibacterales bacterium]
MRWFRRSDEDYREEIAEHVELETQANIDRGMDPGEARRAARVAFGSLASVRQQLHRGRRGYWRSALAQDVRYGLRMIRRNRLLSSVVVLIMGLGIGTTTAVFNAVNALAFAPPVSSDPESFVLFVSEDGTGQVASRREYESLRTQTRSMRQLAAWSKAYLAAPIGETDGARVQGVPVSCNLLTTISDVPPLAGRLLHEEDCTSAALVAVMSRDLWRLRFTSDPGIVGKSISYGGHPLTIVGVAALSAAPDGLATGLWLPYTSARQLKELNVYGTDLNRDDSPSLGMVGRLAPGYSRRAAAAEFRVLTSREPHADSSFLVGMKLTDGSLWSMAPADTLWMFSTALAFPMVVTLIVCAAVATLLLSRAVKRQREMAIRLAVGGSRFGLFRMLLVENVLLSGIAALVSLAILFLTPTGALLSLWGPVSSTAIRPDWKVVTFMGVMTFFTAVAAGLAPALESLNLQLGESLKGRLLLAGRGITWTRALLVGAQVTFSMVLLVAAAGIIRAERFLANPGFESQHVLSAELPRKPGVAQTPSSLAALVGSLPRVRSTAYSTTLPLVFEGATILESPGPRNQVLSARVSPTYFDALGIRILQGRSFEVADESRTGERPVVVSQRFATRFLPGQNPIGYVLTESGPAGKPVRLVIVGVAADRATGFGPLKAPNDGSFIYQLAEPSLKGYLLVRFDGDVRGIATALQNRLKEATGWVIPVSTIQTTLEQRMMLRIRAFERWMTAIGAIGLGLALIGVFGLLAFTAAQRRKEIAIRTTLGACRPDIFRAMVSPAMRPTGIGIVVGAFLAFAALRLAESQRMVPVGVPSIDPVAYLAGGLLLLVAALAAMTPPAYRATRSDPAQALRED